jgi:hypothetical protein
MRRSSSATASAHQITVSVRIRPTRAAADTAVVTVEGTDVVALGYRSSFPASVIVGSDQEVAFASLASDLLRRLEAGYSVTLLAYGQTGSGKVRRVAAQHREHSAGWAHSASGDTLPPTLTPTLPCGYPTPPLPPLSPHHLP